MAKPNTVIPFSKFINITTSGVSDTFTFNRLNALVITTPLIPMPATVEAGSQLCSRIFWVHFKKCNKGTKANIL